MNNDKHISLLIIFLVISIPINAAAYTGSLNDFSYSGKAGSDEMLARTDSLEVSVNAQILDQNKQPIALNENNVKITYSNYEQKFTKCSNANGSYACTYSSGLKDWVSGRYDLTVKLYDNSFIKLDEKSGYFYIDGKPPIVRSLAATLSDKVITVAYAVEDVACDGCAGICAGLEHVDITYSGSSETIEASGCTDSGTYIIDASALPDGDIEICIQAYDILGFSAEKCTSKSIDNTAPVHDPDTFEITVDGLELNYVSGLPFYAEISIILSDIHSGIDSNDIIGDFSGLNQNIQGPTWVSPSCTKSGSDYVCKWRVLVDGANGQIPITIQVTDQSGNTNEITKTLSVSVDTDPPVVMSIRPEHVKQSDNTIILEIQESGSGMSKADAVLDLHTFGLGDVTADECVPFGGIWECYWFGVNIAGSRSDMNIRIANVRDDVGNEWDSETSERLLAVELDKEVPVIMNITLAPLGSDLEILRDGDIVSIESYILERGAGLMPERVLADYSDIYSDDNYTNAATCVADNNSIYFCIWQYAGPIDVGQDIRLNIIATDEAGNTADSATRGVFGKIYAAGTRDELVDFWSPEAEVYDVKSLNRNFLWMSSTGTYIRAGMRLTTKRSLPYVHGFEVTSCEGSLNGIPEAYEPYTIKDQFYYPGKAKSDKYIVVNIPHYEKGSAGNATGVHIRCQGEIIQSRAARSDVLIPNEEFNATIAVTLTNDIYSEPDVAAVDKITAKKDQYNKVSKLVKMISFWVNLLKPICTLVQLARQLINGVCILYEGIMMAATTGTSTVQGTNSCFLTFLKFDEWWYGPEAKEDAMKNQGVYNLRPGLGFLPQSTKQFPYVGWICDLVLCEDCSKFWGSYGFSQTVSQWTTDTLYPSWEGLDAPEYATGFGFNPYESLIVALWCNPPCLYGILLKLETYKAILEVYNVCVNVATIRGEDISECDDFYKHQVCQQIVGEFWYLIEGFVKQYIINIAMWAFEQKLLRLNECVPKTMGTSTSNTGSRTACYLADIYRVLIWFNQAYEVYEKFNELTSHDYNQTLQGYQDGVS